MEVYMNKILDKLIDLVFDKHCQIEEVAYQQDELVCNNLEELKKEIKEVIKLYIDNKD
jgi:hypothetical protein